jgi:hypothetical protein
MNDERLITVVEIAETHGVRRQTIHRIIRRRGIETHSIKSSAAHGQTISAITTTDYDLLRPDLVSLGSDVADEGGDISTSGVFYIVQLEPELDPGRIKLGFASDINERLRSHRTSAPFSKTLRTWPCKLLWEKTAIDCIGQECEQLHTEVFRASAIEDVIAKAEAFFRLMPVLARPDDNDESGETG